MRAGKLCYTRIRYRPYRQLGPVPGPELPEKPIQVLLDRAFRQAKFIRDFLVQPRLADELDNLLLPKTEIPVESATDGLLRMAASWAKPGPCDCPESLSAAKACSESAVLSALQTAHSVILLRV